MKFIHSRIHGFLDYMVVAFLIASPNLFNLAETTSNFTYILAGVHFLLTLFTNFEFGLFKVVSFEAHGVIELVVSISLVIVAFILEIIDNSFSRDFYLGVALVVFLTYKFTDYRRMEI